MISTLVDCMTSDEAQVKSYLTATFQYKHIMSTFNGAYEFGCKKTHDGRYVVVALSVRPKFQTIAHDIYIAAF
jgi:hypothetical protein